MVNNIAGPQALQSDGQLGEAWELGYNPTSVCNIADPPVLR